MSYISDAWVKSRPMASERMMMVLLRPSMHHINTVHDDATKNHDGAATQRTLKYGGWNSSKAGNEASLEYDQSTGDDGTTIDHPSHGHKTCIFGCTWWVWDRQTHWLQNLPDRRKQ